jgi:hypothetical protein
MDFPERPIRCDRAGEVKEMGKTQDIREAVEAELNALIADGSDVFEVHDDLAITG